MTFLYKCIFAIIKSEFVYYLKHIKGKNMKQTVNNILRKSIYLSVVVIVITGISIWGSNRINQLEESKCWDTLVDSSTSISREITLRIRDNENILALAAKAITRGNMLDNREELSSYISSISEVTIFERIDLIYPDKKVLLGGKRMVDFPSDLPYTDLALLGEHMSIRMTDVMDEEQQVINYFVPLKDGKETIAILVGVISCEKLTDVFSTKVYNGKTHIGIVDTQNGEFIMDDWHTDLADVSILKRHKLMKAYAHIDIVDEIMNMRTGTVAYVSDINGKDSYMSYMPVGIDDWQLLVVVQEDVAFASFIKIRRLLTGITFCVLAILVSYYCHAISVNTKILKNKKEVERKLLLSDTLIECIKTLSQHDDSEKSVNELLKSIRVFFDADRAYLFEIDYEKEVVNNTYEDIKKEVSSEINILQNVPLYTVESWIEAFEESGMFIINNLDQDIDRESDTYEILARQNIYSLVAIPLKNKDQIIGFLGIDNPSKNLENVSLISSVTFFLMDSIAKRDTRSLLERLSYEDALTGLYNRNKFSLVMDEYELGRRKAKSLGFAYFDLNGLKKVNDESGHKAGDLLIQNTAKSLLIAFGADAYRIGGDEFTVILPDISEDAFRNMTESVKILLAEQGISVSVGISWKGKDYNVGKQLYEADKEMYSDKRRHYLQYGRRKED